jgi:hypothetical protein
MEKSGPVHVARWEKEEKKQSSLGLHQVVGRHTPADAEKRIEKKLQIEARFML